METGLPATILAWALAIFVVLLIVWLALQIYYSVYRHNNVVKVLVDKIPGAAPSS